MGVHGLTPFLRKTCPTVIRNLPERFQGLRGKRVVIDGTLITLRFHFVPDKHPYQHIISWYRFAQELNDHDVSAICIFDGKERNKAKARELQRRRDVRDLAIVRAAIEQERFARLVRVKKTLHSFEQLHDVEKGKVAALLATDPSFGDADSSTLLQHTSFQDEGEDLTEPHTTFHDDGEPTLPESPLPPLLEDEQSSTPPGQDADLTELHLTPTTTASEVAAQFKLSFQGFKSNVAKLVTLSVDQPPTTRPEPSSTSQEDDRVEKVMSKSQHGLALNESKFWKDCMTTLTGDTSYQTVLGESKTTKSSCDQLESLVDRSSIMVSMYERQTNVPTQETYKQAREILGALGIPCIEVTGASEAEALASSIVRAGLADYVVSEDTDVLVYEAPLIRNMTTRDPFVVSGSDIRKSLQLTHDEYIDFAILLGTDFSERITNVGPVRALSFIRELGSIENIVESIENHPRYQLKLPKAAYLAQVDIARSVFKTLPPLPSSACFESIERNDEEAASILEMYGILHRDIYPESADWRYEEALVGNHYNDTPFS